MIFIYVFGGLLLLFLLLTLLAPGRFVVERKAELAASAQAVSQIIADFHRYTEWNPWMTRDETVQISVSGAAATAGHCLSWKGKKTGSGEIVLQSANDSAIHWLIHYTKPWKMKGEDRLSLRSTGANKVEISWQHRGQLPWPFARLMGGFVRRSLGYQFESAFENLKKLL